MQTPPSLAIVFVALGVVFLCFAVSDYLKAEGKMTIARRTWLRVALIFTSIGIALYFLQLFV